MVAADLLEKLVRDDLQALCSGVEGGTAGSVDGLVS